MKINKTRSISTLSIYIGLAVLIMATILQMFLIYSFNSGSDFGANSLKISIFDSAFLPLLQYSTSFFLVFILLLKSGILPFTIKNKKVQRIFVIASFLLLLIYLSLLIQCISNEVPISMQSYDMGYEVFAIIRFVYTMPLINKISLTGVHILYGCLIGGIYALAFFEPSVHRKKEWKKDSNIYCLVFALLLLACLSVIRCRLAIYFVNPNSGSDILMNIEFLNSIIPVLIYVLIFFIIGMLLFYTKFLPMPLKIRKLQKYFLIIAILIILPFLFSTYKTSSYYLGSGFNFYSSNNFFQEIFYPFSLVAKIGEANLEILWSILLGTLFTLGCYRPTKMISREEYYRRPIE